MNIIFLCSKKKKYPVHNRVWAISNYFYKASHHLTFFKDVIRCVTSSKKKNLLVFILNVSMIYIYIIQRNIKLRNLLTIVSPIPGDLKLSTRACYSRLLILFCFVRNGRNISYQFKKQNKTIFISFQISIHFDFPDKFRPECSGFISHVLFRAWKAIKSNWYFV